MAAKPAVMSIYFDNKTDDSHIRVLVFSRPYPTPLTVETARMAWLVLRIPPAGGIVVNFPTASKIGAYYCNSSGVVLAGPHDAEEGSTWIAGTESDISLERKGKDLVNQLLCILY